MSALGRENCRSSSAGQALAEDLHCSMSARQPGSDGVPSRVISLARDHRVAFARRIVVRWVRISAVSNTLSRQIP